MNILIAYAYIFSPIIYSLSLSLSLSLSFFLSLSLSYIVINSYADLLQIQNISTKVRQSQTATFHVWIYFLSWNIYAGTNIMFSYKKKTL